MQKLIPPHKRTMELTFEIFTISRSQKMQLHKRKTDDIIKFETIGLFDVIIGENNVGKSSENHL